MSMPIALSWSGHFAISIRTASGGPLAAFCTARWRAECRRRSACRSVSPGRQVVCMAGDGGFTMLLGDLLTVLQENVPIKIVVFDNGKLGFIDIEQKSAGIEPIFTDLKNPDFGKVAEAMGLWGRCVTKAGELEEAVVEWLAQPGPALLDVKVNPMQLVTPPSPFVRPEAVVGMAVYTAKAMLHGKGRDVWEMVVENIP